MPSTTIITPWRDHPEFAVDYLAALQGGPMPDQLLVIDNGSEPPLEFAKIRNRTNLGFTRACNQGLAKATGDICIFLNNDVKMISEGWLDSLVSVVQPGILAGPRLRFDRHADVDGEKYPYLDGWCLAGTRVDMETLGGFDESLSEPAYYSDNLICLRARLAGMTLREQPIGLHHLGGGTIGAAAHNLPATISNQAMYRARVRKLMVETETVKA